jgi:type VI secretion system protein ImpJ
MEAHEIPEEIQWHEGLMLAPQHFQQLSLRQESLLQYVAGTIAPFNWGVSRESSFVTDKSALADGKLRVTRLDAVMPDGLVVCYDARGDRERGGDELVADISPYAGRLKGGGVLTVYLAVATRDAEPGSRGRDGRYRSIDGDLVKDEQTGDNALAIPRLRPRLKLFADVAPGKNYVSFPLAHVRHSGAGYTLEGSVPPSLAVEVGSALGRMCSESARNIRDKARFLADRLRGAQGESRTGLDIETEAMIRRLVAPLPQLEAVLFTGVSHPFLVYLAFCGVAGQVASLDGKFDPPFFNPYDHDDLAATFKDVLDFIRDKVEAAVASTFTVHAFTYDQGAGAFYIKFKPEWERKRLVLGMRTRPGMSESELARWGVEECVIGSRSKMESLRRKRMSGAARAVVERDEDLVPPRDVVLFSLDARNPEFVVPGEDLLIFNADERGREKRPSAISLYVRHTGAA